MNKVTIVETLDQKIVSELSVLAAEVMPQIIKMPKGNQTLEEFNNQIVDFDADISLGEIHNAGDFRSFYAKDHRVLSICDYISTQNEGRDVQFRNFYYYPSGTFMAWHTNSNGTGKRLYYTLLSSKGDIFRYRDPSTKKIIDIEGKPGWNAKQFLIGRAKKDLLWHTIYATGPRFSFGFNIIDA